MNIPVLVHLNETDSKEDCVLFDRRESVFYRQKNRRRSSTLVSRGKSDLKEKKLFLFQVRDCFKIPTFTS